MDRWFNGEIAFGFVVGVLTLLLLIGVSSYQLERCGEINRDSGAGQAENNRSSPSHHESDGNAEKHGDDESHPIFCGIASVPDAFIGYMDSHE
jgi:hypothetical protein